MLIAAGGPARAVELVDDPVRVNAASDAANSIVSWDVIPDEKNGLAVIWAKDGPDVDAEPDQLFVRFYKKTLKPDSGPKRYDDQVGGATPAVVSLAGSAMLGGGKLVSVWEARFAGAPAQGVIQYFDGQKPDGGPKSVEDASTVSMLFTRPLSDGRAVVPWVADGSNSEVSGRLVQANGKLGPADLTFTLGPGGLFPNLYTLDRGMLAAAFRPDERGKSELAGQVYDANGKKEGGAFTIVPNSGVFQQVLNIVGLASGDIVLAICMQETDELCDLKGQVFKRNGRKSGPEVTLVKRLGPIPFSITALEKSGFLLTTSEGAAGSTRLAFRRFDDRLKLVGKVAKTKLKPGLRRGAVKLLGDGRAAAAYTVNGSALYVQVVKP